LPTFRLNDEARSKIRNQYVCGDELLLTFYGFVAPHKGIEVLFEIVAKTNSLLLIASDFNRGDEYHKSLLDMIRDLGIESRVKIMGFMPDDELARILAVSDAAVFPFRDGAAVWNTSIDGAAAQGVFILTTSLSINGYSESRNIYYAMPGDSREMITALHKYAGLHVLYNEPKSAWKKIAEQHIKIYSELL
jgi:glycosyltransferase involved in cell wall biosynthesis